MQGDAWCGEAQAGCSPLHLDSGTFTLDVFAKTVPSGLNRGAERCRNHTGESAAAG